MRKVFCTDWEGLPSCEIYDDRSIRAISDHMECHISLVILKTWHANTAKDKVLLPIEFAALRVWPVGLINNMQQLV